MSTPRVVLGVSGSIAAYRALDVVRGLRHSGVDVQVVVTKAALHFVSPLSFRVLSQNPVYAEAFAEPTRWTVNHISLADYGDLVLVCPATANIIGKVASGIADDLLTAVIMATRARVAFCPAMNEGMWLNPIVQANVNGLKALGYHFLEPGEGHLACGQTGKGRLPEPNVIVEYTLGLLQTDKSLSGKRVVITAGPTWEAIDAVRFIGNRSSGRMGYELADVALRRGADVVLITGPTALLPPHGVRVIGVESAREMYAAVTREFGQADIVIKCAAVADYTPSEPVEGKMKKGPGAMELRLERTKDILEELGRNKGQKILVGFAAETEDLLDNAREKLLRKNLDLIVANPVCGPDSAFASETSRATIVWANGKCEDLGLVTKRHLANAVIDRLEGLISCKE